MTNSLETFINNEYPEKIESHVMRFHLFGIESISNQLDSSSWSIAHQEFDGKSIPCLTSSDLHYQPKTKKHEEETMTGVVRAHMPQAWYRSSTASILDGLREFVDDYYVSRFTLQQSLDKKALNVFDEDGSCIAIIEAKKDESSVTLTVDTQLERPDDIIDYYQSVKQSVELWGYLHDYIAHDGESRSMPMRFISGDPQHEIYIGGAQPTPTTIEMDLMILLEELNGLDSELPTPTMGDIDFEEVQNSAITMDAAEVIDALKHVIVAKRIFSRYTKKEQPISTNDLITSLSLRQSDYHRLHDKNNHRDSHTK